MLYIFICTNNFEGWQPYVALCCLHQCIQYKDGYMPLETKLIKKNETKYNVYSLFTVNQAIALMRFPYCLIIRESSENHQRIIRESSENHQKIIRHSHRLNYVSTFLIHSNVLTLQPSQSYYPGHASHKFTSFSNLIVN